MNTEGFEPAPSERVETARLEPVATPASRGSLLRVVTSRDWTDPAAAAAVAALGLLCVAAFLLLAPKVQNPGFARGAGPVAIFNGIVIVALGILRVPVHIGGITVSALPLGALGAAAVVIVWSVRTAFGERDGSGRVSAVGHGARVGLAFGVFAWLLALVFRFRGREQVSADALWSLLLGTFWGTVFASVAITSGRRPWRAFFAETLDGIRSRSRRVSESVIGAGVMMLSGLVLAAGALLLWIIVGLARGAPYESFGMGDAIAAFIYLAAFLPNLLIAIVTLGLGAPITRGVQVGFGGRVIGGLQEISLFDWPGGTPLYAYLLLTIPLAACLLGGFYMGSKTTKSADMFKTIVLAALIFAASLALVGWLGEARLGAGLVKQRGIARVAIEPFPTFVLATLWASVAGTLGWIIAERSPNLGLDR